MLNLKSLFYNYLDFRQRHSWRKSLANSIIHGEVLMYHHVTDEYVEIMPSCRCAVKVFEHYLDEYEQKGFRFVSLDEAYNIIKEGKDSSPFCILTFDDIPDNVYHNAYPILKRRGIPFAVFITTNYVDWTNPKTGEKYITMEHLQELDKDPLCTVGAHTVTHPKLRCVNNPKQEMQESKQWLENNLGHSIDYLAYPYGKHSAISCKIQRMAKEIGFKCAFGTIEAPVTDRSSANLFYLPRNTKY